jgi:hypothetical protein
LDAAIEAVVSDPLAFGHHVFGVFGLQSLDLASSALGLNFVGLSQRR